MDTMDTFDSTASLGGHTDHTMPTSHHVVKRARDGLCRSGKRHKTRPVRSTAQTLRSTMVTKTHQAQNNPLRKKGKVRYLSDMPKRRAMGVGPCLALLRSMSNPRPQALLSSIDVGTITMPVGCSSASVAPLATSPSASPTSSSTSMSSPSSLSPTSCNTASPSSFGNSLSARPNVAQQKQQDNTPSRGATVLHASSPVTHHRRLFLHKSGQNETTSHSAKRGGTAEKSPLLKAFVLEDDAYQRIPLCAAYERELDSLMIMHRSGSSVQWLGKVVVGKLTNLAQLVWFGPRRGVVSSLLSDGSSSTTSNSPLVLKQHVGGPVIVCLTDCRPVYGDIQGLSVDTRNTEKMTKLYEKRLEDHCRLHGLEMLKYDPQQAQWSFTVPCLVPGATFVSPPPLPLPVSRGSSQETHPCPPKYGFPTSHSRAVTVAS